MSDSKKSREELLAELTELRRQVAEEEAGTAASSKSTRRDLMHTVWVAPVVLSVTTARSARGGVQEPADAQRAQQRGGAPPTLNPTLAPIANPTKSPTSMPTSSPTIPTFAPSASPTTNPTLTPTTNPTRMPTTTPTTSPTVSPTPQPLFTDDFETGDLSKWSPTVSE